MKSIQIEKINSVKILTREVPIVILFLYFAYLSWWFHEREHRMLDYAANFDHWWYFYHRLREGTFAQWNPFSLFGRIAVQFNYIPISVLFSPFFILLEPTLNLYHNFQVISTFLGISIIYIFGRMLGYGRYYSLIPILLIFLSSSYKYWISFIYFAAFFFFYPLSIAIFLKAAQRKRFTNRQWVYYVVFFSFSLLGLRLEKMIYAIVFVLIMLFSFLMTSWRDGKKLLHFAIAGVSALAIVLVLIGWQMPFLLTSALNTNRVNITFKLSNIMNIELWRWIFLSVVLQKILLLILLNLAITLLFRYFKKVKILFDIKLALLIIAIELILVNTLNKYIYNLNFHLFPHFGALMMDLHMLSEKKIDILFSWHGIVSLLLCMVFYFIKNNKISGAQLFSALSVAFSGFYVAEYSWQYWAIGNNVFNYIWPPVVGSFIAMGAVSLWNKKKYWIVITLVIFHLIGETGSVFLYDILGYPWLPGRAALAEIPFHVIILLESVIYLVNGVSYLLNKLFIGKDFSSCLEPSIKLMIYIALFMNIKTILIPGQEITIGNRKGYKTSEMFPFAPSVLYPFKINKDKNQWINSAFHNANKIKQEGRQKNSWKRTYVGDDIHSWDPMYFKFLPAYSQTLNTAPVYSSEIPKAMRDIFRHDEKQVDNLHYEVNPIVLAYFAYKWKETVGEMINRHLDFSKMTFLPTHTTHDEELYKELMAEEGSNTPRAFLSTRVIKLDQQVEEYRYLKDVLAKGGNVVDQITTSDSSFKPVYNESSLPLKYSLEFERDDPEHIVFKADANQSAYLSLLDLYSPGWRAYIDGVEHRIYRGYIGTRFIAIPEGRHRVEFKYRVPYLIPAMVVSGMGWIIMLVLMFGNIFYKKDLEISANIC